MKTGFKDKKNFLQAIRIAKKDLKANYGKMGIYAGPKRHKEYWARDGFIASFGSCVLNDFDQVKKNLNSFIKFQRNDGHIPLRVESRSHVWKALGLDVKHKEYKVLHKSSQPWATEVVDSNSWFLIAAVNYVKTSGDKKWFKHNKKNFKKVAAWLIGRIHENNLIFESYIANWSDCNLKKGYVIYNNVLAWKAMDDAGNLLGKEGKEYVHAAKKLSKAIMSNFWDENLGYFIDWIDLKGRKHKYFYSDGNLLAVWFGLAGKDMGRRIFSYIDKNGLNKIPVPTGYPKLDWWNDLFNRALFPMYRTQNIFTWLGCVSVVARLRIGDRSGALEDLRKITEKIVEYGTCHEVLNPDGKPVDLWFYKSEKQIAWTAGMYIYACSEAKKGKII